MNNSDANIKKAKYQLDSFLKNCKIKKVRNKKILEIGFKNGLFLNECKKHGLKAFGTEINPKYYRDVKSRYPHLNLIFADGKRIDLPDNHFDYIVSFQVLEHVKSIESLMKECIRLLKKNGIIYHICPNYQSFYEGHYNVLWWPFLTKNTGRLYLKLLGKYSKYYESLNIVKPDMIIAETKKYPNIKLISLGQKEFTSNFNKKQARKLHNRFLKSFFLFIYRLKLIKKLIMRMLLKTEYYYPLVIIIKKMK